MGSNNVEKSGLKVHVKSHPQASRHYDVIIVGAGPGGLTCAGHLLDNGCKSLLMFDPSFTAGRITEYYKEVPSNTRTSTFVEWATGSPTFVSIFGNTRTANNHTNNNHTNNNHNNKHEQTPFEKMLALNQQETCGLGIAIEVAQQLSDGLKNDPRVDFISSYVKKISWRDGVWCVDEYDVCADRVVLAIGSHPTELKNTGIFQDFPTRFKNLKYLGLDECLKPSELTKYVPEGSVVGVVGSSHSAILVLKNLQEMKNVKIVNFYRSPLKYAVYKDGWILYDNTGLKGVTATWAKTNLDSGDENLPSNLRRVFLLEDGKTELEIYERELMTCTHLVAAIGYTTNPLPELTIDGVNKTDAVMFDNQTGQFHAKNEKTGKTETVPGLFGAGIAFPELVTDRVGNVEHNVGFRKFGRFLRQVAPIWMGNNNVKEH